VYNCPKLQTEKTFKKAIDKREAKCYNMQAVNEASASENGLEKNHEKS
jgi:hypothetical protein